MVIVNSTEPFDIDVKRFYVPGASLASKCPKCGREHERDFGDRYIMYPKANTPIKINLYCGDDEDGGCGHEWSVMAVLRVTLEVAPPT